MKTNKNGVILIKILNDNSHKVICKCPLCGDNFEMWKSHFYRGSNSCKCRYLGKKQPRLYTIWTNIKTRCLNPNYPHFNDYGGRGIHLYDEWIEFEPFMKWSLSNGYKDDLTIDRIDTNGNYEPSNCTWVNLSLQTINKTTSHYFKHFGKIYSLKDLVNIFNLSYKYLHREIVTNKRLKDFNLEPATYIDYINQ